MKHFTTTLAGVFAAALLFAFVPALAWDGDGEEETAVERYRMLAQGGNRSEPREKTKNMSPEERERFREERRGNMDEMRETVHLWRMHKMREALSLTDDQFFKVTKIEEDKTKRERELGERFEGALPKLHEALEGNAPDRDIQAHLDSLLKLRDERRRIEDGYEAEMRKVLSPRQQAQFLMFQRQFERKVREVIVEKRMERREGDGPEAPAPPPPPRPRR
jgi:Spy/CpxP family protein refolding chaperone